ncbi:MAG: peptidoglycan DD-metalloendopeptidase family protein [Pseudomonadota bacterium]
MTQSSKTPRVSIFLPLTLVTFGLVGCERLGNLDFDLRNSVGGLDTSSAARSATAERPDADDRGLITYSNYQVAVARRGDTVQDVATRIGADAAALASYNGLRPEDGLNNGEVLALPPGTALTGNPAADGIDVAGIATTALDQNSQNGITQAQPSAPVDGPEPIRHQVARGETAYTIARLYNVSVRSLADWNGLGPDLDVRLGQYLLIPVTQTTEIANEVATTAPGAGTATPQPPSASQPLPEPVVQNPLPNAAATAPEASSNADTSAALLRPVEGNVLRPYRKRSNEGIDIAASAGTAVKAAEAGEVAAITRDTDQVPILVIRHQDNLLTVYANIADISVEKGDRVSRGQSIATVAQGDPSFLHFEVREGFESVDPDKYIK